jgi:Spx/MgsR family transcriptional regulator
VTSPNPHQASEDGTALITLYGIPNCDTVKKARAWLSHRGVAYGFHDTKKLGVPADQLAAWCAEFGWQKVLNRQGSTWRRLPPDEQAKVVDLASAIAVMQAEPSMIKRPVVERVDARGTAMRLLGFDAAAYAALF